MLENGFGEHNIQGIGDKHIPLIHNVTNTDVVVAISDKATDELDLMFNSEAGRAHLAKKGVPEEIVAQLDHFGFSSICNTLAAIKTAKLLDLGPEDALITVATDGAALYPCLSDISEPHSLPRRYLPSLLWERFLWQRNLSICCGRSCYCWAWKKWPLIRAILPSPHWIFFTTRFHMACWQ